MSSLQDLYNQRPIISSLRTNITVFKYIIRLATLGPWTG